MVLATLADMAYFDMPCWHLSALEVLKHQLVYAVCLTWVSVLVCWWYRCEWCVYRCRPRLLWQSRCVHVSRWSTLDVLSTRLWSLNVVTACLLTRLLTLLFAIFSLRENATESTTIQNHVLRHVNDNCDWIVDYVSQCWHCYGVVWENSQLN